MACAVAGKIDQHGIARLRAADERGKFGADICAAGFVIEQNVDVLRPDADLAFHDSAHRGDIKRRPLEREPRLFRSGRKAHTVELPNADQQRDGSCLCGSR